MIELYSEIISQLYLIKIALILPNILFIYLLSKFTLKKYGEKFSINLILILIIFVTYFEFYFTGNHSSYDWLTIQEYPVILRDLNTNYLVDDFFTKNAYESPKILFAKIISFFNIFNIQIENILYFFKVILIMANPVLIFKILTSFNKRYFLYDITPINLAICSSFSLGFIEYIQSGLSHTGWDSFSMWDTMNPMTMANFLCLVSIYVFQNYGIKNIIGIIFLFLGTILHPVVGIVNFLIIFILLNDYSKNIFQIKNFINIEKISLFLLSIVIPITIILFLFQNGVKIDKLELINIYVNYRHPHHYLISSFFDFTTIIWLLFPLIIGLLCFIFKNKDGLKYSIIVFLISFLCFTIQYIFTEIFLLPIIAVKLSPIRFFTHSLFLYIILICIFLQKKTNYKKQISNKKNLNFYLIFSTFFLLSIIHLVNIQKDIMYKAPQVNELILATVDDRKDAIYFSDKNSEWILSYIRAYSKKRIFSDWAFVFNEKAILDWYKRQLMGQKIRKNINNQNGLCLMKKLNISRYIYDKTNSKHDYTLMFKKFRYIFQNKRYVIFEIKNNKIKCD